MISSCLNKREVIKVFSVGRRLALGLDIDEPALEDGKRFSCWWGDNLLAAVTSP